MHGKNLSSAFPFLVLVSSVSIVHVAVPEVCTKDLTMLNPLVGVPFPPVGMTKQVIFTPIHAELVLEMPSHLHCDILVPYTVQVQYVSSTHGLGTLKCS